MADYETLIVTKSDGVASVTLNRPEVRNAISQTMRDELRDVWTSFRYDDEVNCIVLSGAGHSFCTGTVLAAADDGTLPPMEAEKATGSVEVPPASVAFVVEPTDVRACSR